MLKIKVIYIKKYNSNVIFCSYVVIIKIVWFINVSKLYWTLFFLPTRNFTNDIIITYIRFVSSIILMLKQYPAHNRSRRKDPEKLKLKISLFY